MLVTAISGAVNIKLLETNECNRVDINSKFNCVHEMTDKCFFNSFSAVIYEPILFCWILFTKHGSCLSYQISNDNKYVDKNPVS